ncbi:hypothetical protein CLFO_23540 [Clostridium formicaceticum]|uniref:Uncharacterized protein n=1 Tax=Clostridium formicaceticum TaxID=1497 RepID=A0AAC9RLN0_9CLOT|nr:hypothetical protein CLFO_23540 [Clostridium formicaceticum]
MILNVKTVQINILQGEGIMDIVLVLISMNANHAHIVVV